MICLFFEQLLKSHRAKCPTEGRVHFKTQSLTPNLLSHFCRNAFWGHLPSEGCIHVRSWFGVHDIVITHNPLLYGLLLVLSLAQECRCDVFNEGVCWSCLCLCSGQRPAEDAEAGGGDGPQTSHSGVNPPSIIWHPHRSAVPFHLCSPVTPPPSPYLSWNSTHSPPPASAAVSSQSPASRSDRSSTRSLRFDCRVTRHRSPAQGVRTHTHKTRTCAFNIIIIAELVTVAANGPIRLRADFVCIVWMKRSFYMW